MSDVSSVCDQTTVAATVNEPSQNIDQIEPKDLDDDEWDDFGDFAEPVPEEIVDEKGQTTESSNTVVETTTVIADGDDDWDDFADFQEATDNDSSVTQTTDHVPPSTTAGTTNSSVTPPTSSTPSDNDTFAQNLFNTDHVTRLITNAFSIPDDEESETAEVTLENGADLSSGENTSANA